MELAKKKMKEDEEAEKKLQWNSTTHKLNFGSTFVVGI